ncbi:hypothetical protein JCM8097_005578 [Rhodosporidiobolus ruineniae]
MPTPSQSSLETASERSFTSSSSRSNTPNQLDHDSNDPSFDLTHIQTSTPLRPTRHKPRRHEDDPLHASDTESLDLDEDDIDRGLAGRRGTAGVQGDRLTRRSLLELSGGAAPTRSFGTSSGGATPLALPNGQLFSRGVRSDLYAPSPSTGSSTLVDRDEELAAQHSLSRYSKAEETLKARERRQSTLREEREEEEAAEEEGTVLPSIAGGSDQERDESSSSPRPRRHRTGQLASYVDAKMSAAALNATSTPPRRSPKSRRLLSASSTSAVPPTPAAPGAYPPSARKPSSSTSLQPSPPRLPSSFRRSHSSTSPSSAAQVHDIFARHITGPDGALTHAAERRAALSTSTSHPHSHSFVPSSSLPVERERERKGKRRATAQAEEDPSEALTATRQPQKGELEWALKHLSHAQERSVDLDEYFRASVVRGSSAAGFSTEEDEQDEQLQAGLGAGQRSAIDFAMQRSFAAGRRDEEASAEDSLSDDQDLRQSAARRRATTSTLRASTSHSVRFASPPTAPSRSRSRSPSPTPSPPPPRPASAPSAALAPRRSSTPPLPPLPPPILPESPEPARVQPRRTSFLRRSQSFEAPRYEREDREERREREERRLERVEEAPPSPPPREEKRASPAKSPRRSSSRSQPEPAPSSSHPSAPATRSSPPRSRSSNPAPQPASAAPPAAEQSNPRDAHSLPHLVSQLSSAVRALTAAQTSPSPSPSASPSTSPPRLNDQGLPRPRPAAEERDGLKHQLERRRKESDRRRRELEGELREMERRGASEGDQRAAVLEQLAETYVVEHELGCKVDELRKSIEGMGQLVGDQVASAVGETIREDTKRRAHWLAWVLGLQVLLFLLFLRLANSRLSSLYPSMYHDPFAPPALFHLPPHVFSLSSSATSHDYLSPETLAAFAPVPPTSTGFSALGGVFGGVRRWVGALLAQAARVAPVASAPPVRSPFVAIPV